MKKLLVLTALVLGCAIFTGNAQAAVLFSEDFNTGNSNVIGVPSGVDETWYAATFEAPDDGAIADDVGMAHRSYFFGSSTNNRVGWTEDDRGLLFNISTTGYNNIALDFDWRTEDLSDSDGTEAFKVGYFVGSISGFSGNTVNLQSGPASWANWNQIFSGIDGNGSINSPSAFTLSLANNAPSVWVAFWTDGSEDEYGIFDNINVNGDIIPTQEEPGGDTVPEPASMTLLGIGLLGAIGAKLRRKK